MMTMRWNELTVNTMRTLLNIPFPGCRVTVPPEFQKETRGHDAEYWVSGEIFLASGLSNQIVLPCQPYHMVKLIQRAREEGTHATFVRALKNLEDRWIIDAIADEEVEWFKAEKAHADQLEVDTLGQVPSPYNADGGPLGPQPDPEVAQETPRNVYANVDIALRVPLNIAEQFGNEKAIEALSREVGDAIDVMVASGPVRKGIHVDKVTLQYQVNVTKILTL